jgi:hypothetical protein
MPQTASMVMDLVAEAQDWPKSGEFAKRFKMALPPGVIPPDEMTPEMQALQDQNSKLQAAQQALAAAEQQAKTNKMLADGANAEARARLAEAQAYKAILDARSRAADVTGKNIERDDHEGERDFRRTLDSIDQHNDLAQQDREHALDVHKTTLDHGARQFDQFADLAKTDADIRLQREFQQHQEETADEGGSGQSYDL